MMPNSNTIKARMPAAGTPMITSATPINSIWIKAMPTTPCATARMVEVHSSAICGPRTGPEIRVVIATAVR